MLRLLAHRISAGGCEHRLAILTVMDDGNWTVTPFEREEHSVRFVDGTLTVGERPSSEARLIHNNPPVWQTRL